MMMPKLIVNKPDFRLWSNGAKDELVGRKEDGVEAWKIYRDFNNDSIMESIIIKKVKQVGW